MLNTSSASVRRYEFRAAGGHANQSLPGAPHASELPYVFREKVPYSQWPLTTAQMALARRMGRLWGDFASGTLDAAEWPACSAGRAACDHVLLLDTPQVTVADETSVDDGSAVARCGHWRQFM